MTELAGKVAFCIETKFDAAEIGTWEPDRIRAFWDGVAQVLSANGEVAAPIVPDIEQDALPDDMFDAFEGMKMALMRHRAEEWHDITRDAAIGALWTLIRLVEAP